MSILYIVSPTVDFNIVEPDSKLLVSGSSQTTNTCHTSLADMSAAEILTIAEQFDSISFFPQGFDHASDTYNESLVLLNALSHKKRVVNHTIKPVTQFLSQDVITRPDAPVLWVFGCSHGHGVGLLPNEKNFGQILANDLNLPLMQITMPGSSFNWSFRHLINANIRANDYVIWQITVPHRLSQFDGTHLKEILLSQTKNRCLLDVNDDNQVFFNHISLLIAGVIYLRKIGVKFLLTDVTRQCSNYYEYKLEYSKYHEYVYCPNLYIDFGTDGIHVGPLSHQALAKHLLDQL